ncbi:MAG TPA: TolC family protein [Puia sp.]|nr:TolC family protein [Puia sp.]
MMNGFLRIAHPGRLNLTTLKSFLIIRLTFLLSIGCLYVIQTATAQSYQRSDSSESFTLDQCIDYAFKHQPGLNKALIGQSITRTTNAINVSGWYPQVNFGGNFTHYFSLPTALTRDSQNTGNQIKVHTGVENTFIPALSVTQALFSPSLLYASKSVDIYVKQSEQITDSAKIDVVTSVSKAFYNLLLTIAQIDVLKEDTARLAKNYNDAYQQYIGGIVDMTDYQEAAITLNNSKAQLKQAIENVVPQYATLKQFMGYPPRARFNVIFDTLQMKNDISFDTTQELVFEKRIEYQLLQTNKMLQHQVTDYYRSAWIPTVSAFFNYNFEFENNSFAALSSNLYPYSFAGLSLNVPIFTGFYRLNNIKRSKLEEQLLDWNQVELKSQIYTEYTTALASYKGNLYNLYSLQDNVSLAKNVYDIVALQYQQGVVPYLNVITAESNLISSQIGYLNALYSLLSSKIDLQKSMGVININH